MNPKLLAWVGGIALILLHLDFWRPKSAYLVFGWLPADMAYRLVWMLLAWGYLVFFTHRVWDEGDE